MRFSYIESERIADLEDKVDYLKSYAVQDEI